MPASVYEPISTVLKNSFYGPKSPGLSNKMNSALQKNLLVPVRENLVFDLLTSHSCLKVQFDDPVRQSANLSEKQKSKYVILTTVTSNSNGDSSSPSDSKAPAPGKLDQVPEPRVTYFRREQVELGYRGPAGPGSGMFNMGNTCYLNSTLQVKRGYSCVVNI